MNFPRAFRRVALTGVALCASALIAACGGGDQVDQFQPTRILSFGDETNVIVENDADTSQDGRNYGVNDLSSGTVNCNTYVTWNQRLASRYGLTFNECGGTSAAPLPSRIYASATGRSVAALATQVDGFLATGAFTNGDLVTVHTGWDDIIRANSDADAIAAGQALAVQINRIAATGARVLFLTVHRLGETPYGRNRPDAATLSEYTAKFNNALRNAVTNDGRKIVLVDADLRLHQIIRFVVNGEDAGFSDSIVNGSTPLCTNAVLTDPTPNTNCTNLSGGLVAGSNPGSWLFADSLRWSPGANQRIGDLAYDRARNNPL